MDIKVTSRKERGTVLALIADVFFGVTVRNTIRKLNFEAQLIKSADELTNAITVYEPDLIIVDLNLVGNDPTAWAPIEFALDGGTRLLAFGPHMDVESLRYAKSAGATRVVSNSQFHREMGDLIERYALPPEGEEPEEE